MPRNVHITSIQITLVLGSAEGFGEDMLEYLSDQAGDSTESPEDYLTKIEDMLEDGELTLDDIRQFIKDKSK